jgi:hypothetical protein
MRRVALLYACWGLAVATWSASGRADPAPTDGALPAWANWFPHLELEFPALKPFGFSFTSTAVPGYETLRLPTFDASATLWQSGRFSLYAFSRVAPALELDCTVLCQPVLEQAAGVSAQYSLGALAPRVPESFLYLGGARVQTVSWARGSSAQPRAGARVLGGVAGLLDF